jgi:hypothetical protein
MPDLSLASWTAPGYPPAVQRVADRIVTGWWPQLQIGRGWWELVAALDARLSQLDPEYRVTQIRAANGVLQYDVSAGADDEFLRLVIDAETTSAGICEQCGRPGTRHVVRGGRVVACDEHWNPLTDAEIAFAIAGGIPSTAFTDEKWTDRSTYAAASRVLNAEIDQTHLSAGAVAELLHIDAADVHEMFRRGELADAERHGLVVYPEWQFTNDGSVLPGLREILLALPSAYHPLDIRTVMTAPAEELGGHSPREWLRGGGSVQDVVAFAESLNYS